VILLLAVLAGIVSAIIRMQYSGGKLNFTKLHKVWLVPLGFLPQLIVYQLPGLRNRVTDELAAIALVSSQLILLVFAIYNRRHPGLLLLGIGLGMNLAVILINGGLMPISPDTVTRLVPDAPRDAWEIGRRFGVSKDIILPVNQSRLWWLSDQLLSPEWSPYKVAFSLGDVLIAVGAFWSLWVLGNREKILTIGNGV